MDKNDDFKSLFWELAKRVCKSAFVFLLSFSGYGGNVLPFPHQLKLLRYSETILEPMLILIPCSYSQAVDVGSLKGVSAPTIRILVCLSRI